MFALLFLQNLLISSFTRGYFLFNGKINATIPAKMA